IQRALAAAHAGLRRHGVFYPVEGGRPAQYGLSRHYGFGPDIDGVTPRSLPWLMAEAEKRHCTRMILSSEYLSLRRPAAIAAFAADLEALGADASFLIFSRELVPWLRSLFNQYVKTVDSSPHFRSIDAFVDHVLANGAIDIARRYQAWANAVGAARLAHHHIAPGQPPEDVLTPFSEFAGLPIAAAQPGANRSLSPGALYLTGLIRQALPTPGRDHLLAHIAASDCAWVPVPAGYLEIGPEHMARLDDEIATPFAALPRSGLPVSTAA
ncbi:MAG: hypothetical protein V3R90_00330, partial [Limibaculum sp.]